MYVLVKVERSARQQEACCGEVKQAVEKRKGFGLRRQSRLKLCCWCWHLYSMWCVWVTWRANGCWYQCNSQVGRVVVTITM